MAQNDRTAGLVGNTGVKAPVKAASTAALVLSGEQTIDGVACVSGDRVLVKDQADGVDNGVYEVDTGAWSRTKDFDGQYDVLQGSLIVVAQGTAYGGQALRLTTANPITIGTTSLAFDFALSALTLSYTPATGVLAGILTNVKAFLDKLGDAGTALGAALIGFLPSGTGAVSGLTVQSELRKAVHSSQYDTTGHFETAAAALTGTWGALKYYVVTQLGVGTDPDGTNGKLNIFTPTTDTISGADIFHHADQTNASNATHAFAVHNYTDGESAIIDMVGSNVGLRIKQANNASARPDKAATYVGTGIFLDIQRARTDGPTTGNLGNGNDRLTFINAKGNLVFYGPDAADWAGLSSNAPIQIGSYTEFQNQQMYMGFDYTNQKSIIGSINNSGSVFLPLDISALALRPVGDNSIPLGSASKMWSATYTKVVYKAAMVTETTAARTVTATDSTIICNKAGTVTLTLPAASGQTGRTIRVKTVTANTVVSASSNVVPIDSTTAGTAILAATAGKWADLESDGTNWVITAAN